MILRGDLGQWKWKCPNIDGPFCKVERIEKRLKWGAKRPLQVRSIPSAMPTIPTKSRASVLLIVVGHNGVVRIERGFMRAEDEAPEPEAETIEDGENRHRRARQRRW